MGTLNPDIPAPDLSKALDTAARSLPVYGRRVLTPEALLLVLTRGKEFPAYQLLERLAREARERPGGSPARLPERRAFDRQDRRRPLR